MIACARLAVRRQRPVRCLVGAQHVRHNALLELAREVPPSILADLLGLTPEAVDRWRELASGTWTVYVAARRHRA